MVTEEDASAIRAVYERDGELSAAIELRRRFPGIADNEKSKAVRAVHRGLAAAAQADFDRDEASSTAKIVRTTQCVRSRVPNVSTNRGRNSQPSLCN